MAEIAPTTLRPAVKAGRNINSRLLIVLVIVFGAALVFFGYSFLAGFLWPETMAEKKEDQPTVFRPGPDDLLGTLPKDYSWRKQPAQAPVLVPAVITQQGATVATSTAPLPPVPARAPMPLFFPAGSVHKAAQLAHSAREQQQAAMSQGGQGYAPAPAPAPQAQPSPPSQPMGLGGRQELFQASVAGNSALYHGHMPENMPVEACVVPAGTMIPAALAHDVNPNMAGSVTAVTRSDVYDMTGTCLAIPAWSKIETTYDSQIGYGQESLQVVSTILTLPDGRTMSLGGMTAGNAQGMAGIPVDVNNHNLRLFGTAVLGALIDAIPAAAGLKANVNVSTGAEEISSTGRLIVERELQRPSSSEPVLAGTEITIKVPQHIVMNPEAL